jgi:diacylglycerol kinase (ATP)
MAYTNGRSREEIFLFVNPKSGGNKGQAFLEVPQPFVVNLDGGGEVSLRIYSLLEGKPGQKDGYKALKQAVDRSRTPIKVIVGGGDGTVMWADNEAVLHGIDSARQLAFGIVPLGTGNDFSRVAGWGGDNPQEISKPGFAQLKGLVQAWAEAEARPHDVWQVDLDVADDIGQILKVNSEKKEEAIGKTALSAKMINYFSIGQESKVGIEFDKHRTKSQTCNLLVYAFEGASLEMPCTAVQHIGAMVPCLYRGTDDSGEAIFDEREEDAPELVGNPESIMFLNVNSYAGGRGKFWSKTTQFGVKPAPEKKEVDVNSIPGDGKLEVLTLPNLAAIPIDRISHLARRVASTGPCYYLEFYDADEGEMLEAYCEVDGEFYHLIHPQYVKVKLHKTLQVLQKKDTTYLMEESS